MMHGEGMLCWSDDYGVCRYKGSFEHNVFQGHGVLEWSVKARYVGEFFNGLYHGEGTFEWPDKAHVYRGQWQFGEMSGSGTLTTSCGSIYSGEFHAGNMEGRGTVTFITNDQYVGEFKDSLFNGLGSYTWSSGTCLVGTFENNFCNRVGKKTYPNGTTYVGEFLEDQEHGRGVMTDQTGARIVGAWNNGQLVEELVEIIVPASEVDSVSGGSACGEQRVFVATRAPDGAVKSLRDEVNEEGRSIALFDNGDKYIGSISGGRKNGEGMYVYADGSAHKGTWCDDAHEGILHPVTKDAESAELAHLHDMNTRNVKGVAELKSRIGGARTQGPTVMKIQD
mmetsp:Transcript_112275/g.175339  ORF Transcript_112275/g.175339 Transcript_112275/m.175339 type:complete len:337 (+) Transcript_112275:2-1012(+)